MRSLTDAYSLKIHGPPISCHLLSPYFLSHALYQFFFFFFILSSNYLCTSSEGVLALWTDTREKNSCSRFNSLGKPSINACWRNWDAIKGWNEIPVGLVGVWQCLGKRSIEEDLPKKRTSCGGFELLFKLDRQRLPKPVNHVSVHAARDHIQERDLWQGISLSCKHPFQQIDLRIHKSDRSMSVDL